MIIIVDRYSKTTNGTHYASIEAAQEAADIMVQDSNQEYFVCQVVSSHKSEETEH